MSGVGFRSTWHSTLLATLLLIDLLLGGPADAQQAFSVRANIIYDDSSRQLLDLYVPVAPHRRTALLFIHGGGFREGSKEQMAVLCSLYARGGFVATTINYRLTPAHQFPAAVNDTAHAVGWLRRQASAQGFDQRKIVLIGYSAGGNLALMAGLADASGVAGIISAAGASDLGTLLAQTPLPQLRSDLRNYLGSTPPEVASPFVRIGAGDPPVFLFHGDKDAIVPVTQSVIMARRLQASAVPVLLRVFPNAGHEIMLPDTPQFPNPNFETLVQEMTRFVVAIDQHP